MTEYTSSTKRFCSVYKSPRKSEMYLYLDRKATFNELPESLLAVFGEPLHVLDLVLTPEKKLARIEATMVLEQIQEKGFCLQMPPTEAAKLADENAAYPAPKDSLHG